MLKISDMAENTDYFVVGENQKFTAVNGKIATSPISASDTKKMEKIESIAVQRNLKYWALNRSTMDKWYDK